MSSPTVVDINALRQGLEQGNVNLLVNMYADDAQVEIVDRNHQPSAPLELRGKQAIADFLNDIYQRKMTHRIIDEVVGKDRLSFLEACQYPGGERVLASSVVDLKNGKIVRQKMIQAWDES
jgi:hemoglobin-like flavoprotein